MYGPETSVNSALLSSDVLCTSVCVCSCKLGYSNLPSQYAFQLYFNWLTILRNGHKCSDVLAVNLLLHFYISDTIKMMICQNMNIIVSNIQHTNPDK